MYFQKAHGTFPTYLNSFEACQMLIRPAEDQCSSPQPGIEKQKHSCSQWKSEKKCRQLRDFNKRILVDPCLRRVALKRKAFLKLGGRMFQVSYPTERNVSKLFNQKLFPSKGGHAFIGGPSRRCASTTFSTYCTCGTCERDSLLRSKLQSFKDLNRKCGYIFSKGNI